MGFFLARIHVFFYVFSLIPKALAIPPRGRCERFPHDRQLPVCNNGAVGSCTATQSPPAGTWGEREGPVVCLGDAFDDGQAEADACVVSTYAFSAAKERLGQLRDQLRGELFAGVFDSEHPLFWGGRWS